jgi:hypothetical protein
VLSPPPALFLAGLVAVSMSPAVYSNANAGPADFVLRSFAVGDAHVGNAAVEPDVVSGRQGEPQTVTISYDGLAPDAPYLGVVDYEGTADSTVVTID